MEKLVEKHNLIPHHIHLNNVGLHAFNKGLRYSNYLYTDILKEGIVLYDAGITLNKPQKLSPEQWRALGVEFFKKYYPQAHNLKHLVERSYQLDDLRSSIFILHQMTEFLFSAYFLVFTNYKPRSHDLIKLRTLMAFLDKTIKTIFPLYSKEEKKRFAFFSRSYIDSRYIADYHVDPEVYDYLLEKVGSFQEWVYSQCMDKIDSYIPENKFSKEYTHDGQFLNLNQLKTQELPLDAVVEKQRIELRKEMQKYMDLKNKLLKLRGRNRLRKDKISTLYT